MICPFLTKVFSRKFQRESAIIKFVMDGLGLYILFNSISVISGRRQGESEAMFRFGKDIFQQNLNPRSEVGSTNCSTTRTLLNFVS